MLIRPATDPTTHYDLLVGRHRGDCAAEPLPLFPPTVEDLAHLVSDLHQPVNPARRDEWEDAVLYGFAQLRHESVTPIIQMPAGENAEWPTLTLPKLVQLEPGEYSWRDDAIELPADSVFQRGVARLRAAAAAVRVVR
jgi:hypothetical protein